MKFYKGMILRGKGPYKHLTFKLLNIEKQTWRVLEDNRECGSRNGKTEVYSVSEIEWGDNQWEVITKSFETSKELKDILK